MIGENLTTHLFNVGWSTRTLRSAMIFSKSRWGPWPQWGRVSPLNALQPLEALKREMHFAQIMAGVAAEHGEKKTVMIDATYL